jgi:sulfatase maturation enzyme AslB (radical SAM superfamily)
MGENCTSPREGGIPVGHSPGRPESLPDHLPIYLTNRCNLACSYCYVAVNQGPTQKLDFAGLQVVLDQFLGTDVPNKKVTFLGGEPFLDFELLSRTAEYIRDKVGWEDQVVLQTFTNGTLLTPEKLAECNRLGIHVNISLDGKAEINDKHRKFNGQPEKSVLGDVLKRLEGQPKDNLGVSLVFTADTVGKFLDNVDYFYRMGFQRITFTPELYEIWPEEKIALLKVAMQGFRRYYTAILKSGKRPFQVQIMFSVIGNRKSNAQGDPWWHGCHNATLGPDGNYYACDKALTFPIGSAPGQIVGNAETGNDPEKRGEHYRRSIAYLAENGWGKNEYFCPMGPYFYSEVAKEDPKPRLENFHVVAKVFSDALIEVLDDIKDLPAYKELYEDVYIA